MLGTLNTEHREATVIGGGIAGLLAAYYLDRAGFEVTLHEAGPRLGGLIGTKRLERGIAEAAAHSLLVTEPVRRLFDELGVELVPVREDSRARFIWRGGKMRKFPLSLAETGGLLRRALFSRGSGNERTLEDWGRRHLGESAVEYLLNPFVRGIYGARPSELSLHAAFPKLAVRPGSSLLSQHLFSGGNRSARPRMMAPKQGMDALTRRLADHLTARLGGRLRLDSKVDRIPSSPNLVICAPAHETARLLPGHGLESVRYVPLVSVTIIAPKSAFRKPPKGVGVLVPEKEARSCLGILFNSSSFPGRVNDQEHDLSLTMMLGGTSLPELVKETDGRIAAAVENELRHILGMTGDVSELAIHRWERAIPLYDAQLAQAWQAARQGWCSTPGRVLFGNYTGQVSLRGMVESLAPLLAPGLQLQRRDAATDAPATIQI